MLGYISAQDDSGVSRVEEDVSAEFRSPELDGFLKSFFISMHRLLPSHPMI